MPALAPLIVPALMVGGGVAAGMALAKRGGKGPSPPAVKAAPSIAKETDAEVRAAETRERELLKKRRGLRATLLTTGRGLAEEPLLAKPGLKGQMGE